MRIAGINQVIQSVCNIAGPALAGLFITMMKMTNILLLDVAGAAFACLSLCFVFIPDPSHEERNSELHLWREAKEAIMEVRNQYGLSWLFLLSILATFVIMPVADRFWRNRVLREKTGRQKTRSQKIGRLKPYGNRPPDGVTEADRSAFLHQTYHHHRETAKGNPHPNKVWMGIPFFSKKRPPQMRRSFEDSIIQRPAFHSQRGVLEHLSSS